MTVSAGTTGLRLAWRYLRGRGLRSLLTTLAVVLGVMLVFGLNGILPAMMDAFTKSMLAGAGRIDVTVSSAFKQPIEPTVLDTVARTPGVKAASPEVQQAAPLPRVRDVPAADQVAQVEVIGLDPATAAAVRDLPIAAGRPLAAGDADVTIMSQELAGRLGLRLGDQLDLPSAVGSTRFTVVGYLSTPTTPGEEQVYVPIAAAQRLFGLGAKITVVQAALAPGADRAGVEASLRQQLGSDYTVGGLSSNGSLLASIQMSQFAFTLFGLFAMATAGFIILNSFRTVVAERRRDIGMLRAIGAPRATVLGMFLAESVLQGAIGTALGILAGWGLAASFFAALNPRIEDMLHMTIGGPRFEPSTWLLAIVLGVGVTVAAALVPARQASRITPMEAMRPQAGEVYQRRLGARGWAGMALFAVAAFCIATRQAGAVGLGSVLFLIAVALVAPTVVTPLATGTSHAVELAYPREGAIARSNLQRNPGRSAITVTAVMLGLASIVAMMSVISSIMAGFTSYIDKSLGADYMVIPNSIVLQQGNVAAGPRLADEIRHTDGIGPVSTLRVAQGRVNGADVQVIGIDPVTYPKVASLDWNEGSTEAAMTQLGAGRWLIANGIFAGQHGLVPGQQVSLDTPNGQRIYHVAGVGNDYLNAKLATIYVSQDALARDFNSTNDLLIMADRLPSADPAAVHQKLQAIVADYPAFRLYESAQWRQEQMATFDQTKIIFNALIAALALPSLLALVNTLAISVLARTREIGMLRAVGATRRQIRRMVIAESLLLSVIGTVFGVVAGVLLGYALVTAMGSIGWPMPYTFPWNGIAATVIVGIVFGVLAALVPARKAARLDVVDALHHE